MSQCKHEGCRADLIFARTLKGRWLPLDQRAQVYRLQRRGEEMVAVPEQHCFVTHYATCRGVGAFEAKTRKTTEELVKACAAAAAAEVLDELAQLSRPLGAAPAIPDWFAVACEQRVRAALLPLLVNR